GPIHPELRGAGGLRIRRCKARPGPEATVPSLPFQLGACLTGIGQHYDSINESVMIAGHDVAVASGCGGNTHSLLPRFASRARLAGIVPQRRRVRRMSYGDTEPAEFHAAEPRPPFPPPPPTPA